MATKTEKQSKASSTTGTKPAGRGPMARLTAQGGKESVVGKLVPALVLEGGDADALRARLMKVSNQKVLRLARVVETVNKKFGGRAKLIDAVAKARNQAKDADFVKSLGAMALPRLLDLASGIKTSK